MKKFIFFYFNEHVDKVREVVPYHISYWKGLTFESYSGGPFSDKTGGAIVFTAENNIKAKEIIDKDPFMKEKLIAEYYLKEWLI